MSTSGSLTRAASGGIVTFDIALVDEDIFAEGTASRRSSIAGWKAIND